jgi:hypothetical protein
MLRSMMGILAALAISLGMTPANAGFGIGGSVGGGFFVKDGSANRTSMNLEVLPFYKISIVHADLGLLFNFESPHNVVIRPGVRLDFSLLYLRAAIPLRATNGGDYGFLFGLGKIFGIGPVGVFIEADMNLSKELGFSAVPIEFRAGVQFSF